MVAKAWHKAVLANSPFAYKTFHDNYSNSQYATAALKLHGAPKAVHLMQFTHLAKQSPSFKPGNFGNNPTLGISKGNFGAQTHMPSSSKIVTLPAKGGIKPASATTARHKPAIPATPARSRDCPGRINNNPMRLTNRHMFNTGAASFRRRYGRRTLQPTLRLGPVAQSFARSSFGGGAFDFGGGFRRR